MKVLQVHGTDDVPLVRDRLKEVFLQQPVAHLPDRGAADVELVRHFDLGQRVVRLVLASNDVGL